MANVQMSQATGVKQKETNLTCSEFGVCCMSLKHVKVTNSRDWEGRAPCAYGT